MKLPCLTSLGARWTKDGFGHRTTWAMWAVAVLLAVLAVAVPLHGPVSADEPDFTINVSDINYETATASFTVTNLPSSINANNWIAGVKYDTPFDPYGYTLTTGTGQDRREFTAEFTADPSGGIVTADSVPLTRLIPDSEYTLTITIYEKVGVQWPIRAQGSTTFTSKSGCTPSPEPNHKDPESISPTRASWFGIYEFRHVTETEFMLEVSLNASFESKHAPLNSGACVYYKYNEPFGTFQSGILTAYIHDNLSGGKRGATIRHTGLTPATRYKFRLTMDEESDVGDITVSGTTLGPNTGISDIAFTDITDDSADATATIEHASMDPKFVYWHYRTSPINGEPGSWSNTAEDSTEGATFSIALNSLDAGTRYELEASVKKNFNPNMSMTKAFVTLPGKPGISPLEVGDGSLKVTWTAPAETPAPLTGYRVQWQEYDEYFDYNTFPPPTSTLDYDDVAADVTNHTIENLTNGTKYVVIVIAKNASFDDFGGTASDYETGTPMTLPNAPNKLQVVPGIKKLTLTWEEPAAKVGVTVTGYVVEYKKDADTTWTQNNGAVVPDTSSGATTYGTTVPSLDHSTEYDVRVRANNGVTSDDYNWTEGSETTLPDKPTSLAVESGNRQLTLSWEEPSDTGSVNISDYVVQYKKTSDTSWTTSSAIVQEETDSQTSITTFETTFSSLDSSTDYDVRVRADNGVTLQDEDNYNWAEDDGQTIPDSPGNLQIAPGNEALTLTWEAPLDSGSISISGFIVQYKKTADSGWNSLTPLSAAALGTTIRNLDNDDLYFVRVRAVNTAELDEEDDYNWAREEGTPVPSPSIETVTVDANSVTQTEATVTVTLDRTNGVTQKVYLQYRTVPDGEWITPPKPDEDTDAISVDIVLDTFEGNTEYEVQAWLETDVNTKVKSDSFTTKPVPPGFPTNTEVTARVGILKLEWDPPAEDDNGGATIDHYVIEWDEYDSKDWNSPLGDATTTGETYDILNLTNRTRYAVRIRADNLTSLPPGKSYNWVEEDGTPRTIPAEPTVTVTPDNAKLHVSWNKPDNGGEEISGFVVQYKKNADSAWITHAANAGSNTLKTTIPDLDNGELYDVRVRAFNSATVPNEDDYKWGKDGGTPRTIPAEPALTVTAGNTVLEVSWDEPDDGGDDITGHVVQYKKNTDDTWDTSNATIDESTDTLTEITSYKTTISNLDNGETYLVRVRAVNSVVLDDEKDYKWGTGSGKPITIPAEPEVSVTPGNAQLEVNWNKPDAGGDTITGFVVQYMKDTDTSWTDHSTPRRDETSTTISSRDNGEMYTVRVRAVNSVVLDDEDDYKWGEHSGKPRTIPNAPDSVTVTHGNQQLTATWEKPTGTGSDGGDAITGYEVQWKEKSSTGWSSRSSEDVTGIDSLTLTFSQHSGQALTNGVTYEVRVRAVNTVMLTDEEDYKWKKDEETPSTTPGAPQRVRISDQGDGELTVEWSAPTETENGGDDISGYVVQWRVKGISNWAATSTTEDDTIVADKFTHTFDRHLSQPLANGVKCEARVIGKNRNGRGTPSAAVEGKPRTTPNTPTDLEVTEGDAQLELTWTAPTETGGTDIDYYIVEYLKEGESSFESEQTTDDTQGWTLDGLENGKLYTIQVKSHTEGGTSEPSGQATGKPRTIPGKPTITAVTAGNRTLTVTWTPPTDTGGDSPSKYIIEWEEWIESTSTWQASGSAEDENGSPYEISGLTNGTLYRVVVKAHNAAGTGPASDAVEGTPKTIPDAPSVTLTPGDGELKVEWNKPDNGGDEITGFIVQYKKDTDEKWTELSEFGTAALGTTITSLDNGNPYKVWVRAVNTAEPDAGQDYNWGKASDIPRTFPLAPTVSLTHGDKQLEVTWDKPDNGGDTITGFVVQYKKAADAAWIGHSTPGKNDTTTTIIRLDNGVPYDVRVRAVNTVTLDDEDDYSWGKKSETPRTIPEAPTNFEVVVGDEELTLSWVAPTTENNGGAAIKQYVVQWKSGNEDYDPDPDSSRQTTTPLLTKVLADLSNGTLYSIRVRADNGETVDDDDNYEWAEETGRPMTVPGAPTMLRVDQGNLQLVVSWVAPEDTGGEDVEIDHFVIQWQVKGGNWSSPGEHRTTDRDKLTDTINTGLLNGTDYDIRVAAANSMSESDNYIWANTSGKPRTIPGPPRSLSVTAGDGQLTLSWVAPSDDGGLTINRYVVQWKSDSDSQQYNNIVRQGTTSSLSYTIRGLTNDDLHSVRVRADNTVTLPDEESYSWALETGTPAAAQNPPPPPPPQNPPPNNPPPQRSPVNPTPPVTESPEVASVSVTNETQTTADATVKIDNEGKAKNTVNLRYSIDGEDSWTNHTKTEAGSAVEFPLSGLTAGTAYEVEAWLGSDTDNKVTATFTTSMAPSISSIGVGGITKTSATATVNMANPGDAQNTVNLRYSVDGEDRWTDHTETEAGSTVEFSLSSLTAGTTYEVEAWLGSDTDNKVIATFMTTQADAVTPPSISSVRVLNIAQTNARVVVGLANANTGQRVYMQYKLSSAQWPTTLPQPTTQMNGSATFILSNLKAGTGYHTRVSLNSDMSDATTRSFTTSPPPPPQNPRPPRSPVVPPPSVSLVTFNNETQTSADATVNIADAGTAKKTVRLHHRIEGTTGWSTPSKSENTSGSSTTFALMSLTAGTTYEVQAWLNSNAAPAGTTVYTFGTLPNDPGISNLKMENIRQTSATAMVEIADAGTEMKEVYLKHSTDGADEWTQIPFPTITYSDSTSIELTGLEERTTYQVMVDLTDGFDKAKSSTFTTLAAPSLSGVSVGSITQTGAVATATIADAGTAQKTVYLRFREFGESQWSTAQTRTTTDASTTFNLSTLSPRTTYEVQASLESDFSISKFAVFTTLSPDPSVSGVSVGSITQTSATATVTIAYPGIALKTVHLRYRMSGETEWGAVQTKATSGGSTAINLIGLSPRTMYEVEASLGSDFAGSRTTTFSTLSLDPSVSGVSIGSITQTSAAATVTIANPGTAQKTVYLQYRVDGASEWSDSALTATTDGSSATIYMTGLIADTEYEVRASLASDFALAQHATFTTLRYPSISNVEVTDVTKTTATAEIDIANPDGSSQTVHLRHRTTTPQGEWSSTFTTASTTGDASIDLTGLTVDTEYDVEASLTADFAIAVSDTFRTLSPDPVVAEVSVNSIRQTTATAYIDIANANGGTQKVSLRYRTTTPRGNWSDIQTTTSTTDSASIDLSRLTPGIEYDVQASLDSSFPTARTKYDNFTTLRYPSIASVEAENIGRNGATVSAMIADSHGVALTVYVRHRDVRYNAWKPTQQTDSVDDVASIRLRGLSSGTEYIAEASLDNSFPDGGTRSVTFTTKKREDDDDGSSSVGGNVAQAARATNMPLLGFSPQMLRFTAIEGGDNPSPQAFLVWNRAQGAMSFTLSNQQEWLSQQPTSGVSNGPDDQVTITASVDSSALASGQYVDIINIDVSSSGKSPAQVIVVLDVLPPDYIRQFVSRDEGGVVVLPDGTVKIVVQPLAPPKDVDIELMKVNLQAHGQPPGEQERVVVAIESNTYEPGGDTPEDVAYSPYVELWVQLPQEDDAACDESRARVYSVQSGAWSLVEHRCETDESGKVWAVAEVERLGQFALVIDDAAVVATPTLVAAAVVPTPTVMPAMAPAVAVQRISLPAQPPTPVPTSVPTAVPMPNGKTTVAPAMAPTPTPTAVPVGNEPSAPMMQASAGDGGSGGFGRIILAALGVPMLIGTLIVVYLLYRERRRRDDARFIERSGGDW